MVSGGFTAAYLDAVPKFEKHTGHKIATTFGASMGNAPDSLPIRLQRGEPVDVVVTFRLFGIGRQLCLAQRRVTGAT